MKKKGIALGSGIILIFVLVVSVLGGDGNDDACTPSSLSPRGNSVNGLAYPTVPEATFTSGFGPRWGSFHDGIDLAAADGTPLYAFADGVVTSAGPASGYGNWVVLLHEIEGEEMTTVYGHIEDGDLHVSTGDTVTAGQHIADMGNAGFSTGTHLHFGLYKGNSTDKAHAVDPWPWVEPLKDAGGPVPSANKKPDTSTTTSGQRSEVKEEQRSSGKGELPPSKKFAEVNLQRNTIKLGRTIAQEFPEVEVIGGFRHDPSYPDHPSGQAIDVMIPDYKSQKGKTLGDEVNQYVIDNKEEFNLDYTIWRQFLTPADAPGYMMEDRGDDNQNHYNHVHITVHGGGYPDPDEKYMLGAAAKGGTHSSTDCENIDTKGVNEDEIPPELLPWIIRGGKVCEAVDAPLLAGLIYHESAGFQAQAVSHKGAQGYGQFMPETWAAHGAKVDENGEIAGPPGSGSPNDPADATMAAARFLCLIAEEQKPHIASGRITGDPTELMLAGYNAGPGAVMEYGGIPLYDETIKYVKIVPKEAKRFEKTGQENPVRTTRRRVP